MDAPSPFIPGTRLQYAWDSTSLGLLKTCPRKYELTLIEGWRSKSESVHLTFGILFHSALERYDKAKALGSPHDEAVDEVLQWLLEATWVRPEEGEGHPWEPDNSPKKNRETIVRTVLWYLEEYADDVAKTLILENGLPAVELSFRFDTGIEIEEQAFPEDPNDPEVPKSYLLSGHMDRLVTFGDDNFVMDRKTTGSTIGGFFFNQFNPDNQMTLYTIASKIVYNMPVQGVMIDAAQVAVGFTAFQRGITMRSNAQLDEYLVSFAAWMKVAEGYAAEGYWPMNETACGNYGGCVFRDVCNKDPAVRHHFLKTGFEKKFWNPLETR